MLLCSDLGTTHRPEHSGQRSWKLAASTDQVAIILHSHLTDASQEIGLSDKQLYTRAESRPVSTVLAEFFPVFIGL